MVVNPQRWIIGTISQQDEANKFINSAVLFSMLGELITKLYGFVGTARVKVLSIKHEHIDLKTKSDNLYIIICERGCFQEVLTTLLFLSEIRQAQSTEKSVKGKLVRWNTLKVANSERMAYGFITTYRKELEQNIQQD
ncbi:hypothetical protein RFI_31921 [Reticulomyxa filosa]|uniref:Uncharacterized protein n=1 Tax=Reticulomyxa filosa TaxID=46433 RepID=X6LVU3_RETFI|nr:hypothetical protein RFI_31921 [Reticulomyxa filosa]|eukprot:ETO05476.1 hypothetical protein RFI_31921 [Reticulomyxa filosa]